MKTAYVIKCNDSTQGVVLDNYEHAENEKNRLKEEGYMHCIKEFANFDHYCSIFFWHIDVAPVL